MGRNSLSESARQTQLRQAEARGEKGDKELEIHGEMHRVNTMEATTIASLKHHQQIEVAKFLDREHMQPDVLKKVLHGLKCWNIIMMCYAAILTGYALYASSSPYGQPWSLLIQAACGTVVFFIGFLGCIGAKMQSERLLLIYFAIIVIDAIILFCSGGFTLFLLETSTESTVLDDDNSAAALEGLATLKINMIIVSVMSLIFVPVQLWVLRDVEKLVSMRRAVNLLLMTINIFLFLFSLLTMVGGIYLVIDSSGGNVATSYASLLVYSLGGIILVLSFVGCFGTVIESRGLLGIFMWMSAGFCAVCVIAGVICFAQAAQMREFLDENWETIRLGLWPNFTGKYDKAYFINFVQQYQNVLGFVMLAIAAILGVMYGAALAARKELKKLRNAEKRLEAIIEKDEADMDNILHTKHATHHKWRAYWSDGSGASRCVLRTSCVTCCLIIFFLIAGGVIVMVFNVQCDALSTKSKSITMTGQLIGNQNALQVKANVGYKRGAINVKPGADSISVNFTSQITAFQTSLTTVQPAVTNTELGVAPNLIPVYSYTLTPKEGMVVLGTDFTCQGAAVDIAVPAELNVLSMDLEAVNDVKVDLKSDEKVVRFSKLRMKSTQGTVKLKHVEVRRTSAMFGEEVDSDVWGKHGDWVFKAESDQGDIKMESDMTGSDGNRFTCADFQAVNVNGLSQWADVVLMKSTVGMIDVSGIKADNCDIKAESGSPIFVKKTKIVGGVLMVDGRSKISVDSLEANGLRAIARGTCTISGNIISTNDRNDGITATAESGSVNLTNVASQGSIQVETTSGAIEIHIGGYKCVDAPGFGGNFQISTAGKVTIVNKRPKDKDGKSTNNWFKTVASGVNSTVTVGPVKDTDGQTYQTIEGTGNVAGSIHCHIDGNCGYRGELIISSKTADVRIVILDTAGFEWSTC